jgi:hypothetical protein
MVAFFAWALDYEIVMFVFGRRGFGISNFVLWSAPCRPQRTKPRNHTTQPQGALIMTTRTHIAALFISLAATGTAFAQETTQELPQPIVSTVSRVTVVAERDQARTGGAPRVTETDWPVTTFVAQKTRADVRAETRLAIASGELRALNQEPYSAYVAKSPAAPAQLSLLIAAVK